MYCTEASLVKVEGNGFWAASLECRSWQCENCRPKRKRQVSRQAAEGNPTRFVTLTVNPAWGSSPKQRARALVDCWRGFVAFFKWLGYTTDLPYFAVFEATKKGEPHLHILTRGVFIPHWLLSEYMDAHMDAPNVWITECHRRRDAARYVSKYLGKANQKFGTCKRYWCTRSWRHPSNDDRPQSKRQEPGWYRVNWTLNELVRSAWDRRAHIVIDGDYYYMTGIPPPPARRRRTYAVPP